MPVSASGSAQTVRVLRLCFVGLIAVLLGACAGLMPTGGSLADAPAAADAAVAGVSSDDPEVLLAELVARYAGEWSNHAEVFAAVEAGDATARGALINQQIERIDAPQFGRQVFRIRLQFGPAGQQRSRLRLTRFAHDAGRGLIRQDVYGFPDPTGYVDLAADSAGWAQLSPDRLRPSPGCSLWWQRRADGRWVGATDPGQCAAAELGESAGAVTEWLQLDPAQMSYQQVRQGAGEATELERQVQFQRVRYYSGWYALHPQGDKASTAPAADQWHTGRNLRLHDQGGRIPLPRKDGQASGYMLELSRVQYPGQPRRLLRLAFLDAGGRSLGYVWATEDSLDIGANLGWLQVGLQAAVDGSN
jgi:hypothetical protein